MNDRVSTDLAGAAHLAAADAYDDDRPSRAEAEADALLDEPRPFDPHEALASPRLRDLLARMGRDGLVTFVGPDKAPRLRTYGAEALSVLRILDELERPF